MTQALLDFVRAARGAGVRISPAETMDALRAAEAIGWDDREGLRDALALSLAKSRDEKARIEACFDLFFRPPAAPDDAEAAEAEDEQDGERQAGDEASDAEPGQPQSPEMAEAMANMGDLAQALLTNDRAQLGAAMAEAADAVGLQEIRIFTQAGLFARRMLELMGLNRLEQDIEDAPDALAERLRQQLAELRAQVRERVDQALELYAKGEGEKLREDTLRNARISQLEPRDRERMRALVRAMARRLRDRHSRNRKRRNRGQLDTRRTIRKNAGWGGVPFLTIWKQKKIDRPRLMVLCDVSGSVASVSEFLLTFLYELGEALSDLRAFAFTNHLVEVSDILEGRPVDEAIKEIMGSIGFGSSNFGKSFEDFEKGFAHQITARTTVLILGDARGNNTDPRTDVLRRIGERAKRVIWLNPEQRVLWGTGDSDMPRYAPCCHLIASCGTLRQLERVVSDLLTPGN
ncbi:vWA domain-containing protein [Zavarzinia sp. CC-PAN008]|uniref:vWA domain-containing protein n=1 Tax=Zavarzinia sp. CC-PAN008 TaxID=3243332 RepID=UPI003F74874D